MRKDNNYVEMLCVVNVSSTCRQRVVEDCQKDVRTGRRRCAVSWRKRALEWKDKGRKKGTQKRDVFTFKHKSDSTASRFGMKTTSPIAGLTLSSRSLETKFRQIRCVFRVNKYHL